MVLEVDTPQRGAVVVAPVHLPVLQPPQRSPTATSRNAASMCPPQPDHVGFLHWEQLILWHMLICDTGELVVRFVMKVPQK